MLYFAHATWRKATTTNNQKRRSGNKIDALPYSRIGKFSVVSAVHTRWHKFAGEFHATNAIAAPYKLSVLTLNDHIKRHKTIHFDSTQFEKKKHRHISVARLANWETARLCDVINLTSLECFQNFIAQVHAIGGHSICVAVFCDSRCCLSPLSNRLNSGWRKGQGPKHSLSCCARRWNNKKLKTEN